MSNNKESMFCFLSHNFVFINVSWIRLMAIKWIKSQFAILFCFLLFFFFLKVKLYQNPCLSVYSFAQGWKFLTANLADMLLLLSPRTEFYPQLAGRRAHLLSPGSADWSIRCVKPQQYFIDYAIIRSSRQWQYISVVYWLSNNDQVKKFLLHVQVWPWRFLYTSIFNIQPHTQKDHNGYKSSCWASFRRDRKVHSQHECETGNGIDSRV